MFITLTRTRTNSPAMGGMRSGADALMRWKRVDRIGPARYRELEQLTEAVVKVP